MAFTLEAITFHRSWADNFTRRARVAQREAAVVKAAGEENRQKANRKKLEQRKRVSRLSDHERLVGGGGEHTIIYRLSWSALRIPIVPTSCSRARSNSEFAFDSASQICAFPLTGFGLS